MIVDQVAEDPAQPDEACKYTLDDMSPGIYVGCLYDNNWWVGSVRSTCEEEQDVEIVFMHPHGPARSYSWPRREDVCWVPLAHILRKLKVYEVKSF